MNILSQAHATAKPAPTGHRLTFMALRSLSPGRAGAGPRHVVARLLRATCAALVALLAEEPDRTNCRRKIASCKIFPTLGKNLQSIPKNKIFFVYKLCKCCRKQKQECY